MREFKLTFSSLGYFIQEITKLLTENPNKAFRVNVKAWRESRSLSMNAFQHVIYKNISEYLISKGRKDWTEKHTKEQMKNNFLGWRRDEFTNVLTGEVEIKETLIPTSGLDAGEAYNYTFSLLDWAQSIGCEIKIPEKCDYRDLQEKQNA